MTDSEGRLADAINRLEAAIDNLVRKDVYMSNRESDHRDMAVLREDVKEIKDNNKWIFRTVVASLFVPLVTSALIFYVVQQGAR